MEVPIISCSFLMTEEDYRSYRLDSARVSCGKRDRMLLSAVGVLLILGGVAGAAMFSRNLFNYLAWGLCIITGFVASLYFSLFEPVLVSHRAQRDYQRIRDQFSAQTIEFCETELHLKNDRADGCYPYDVLHRCVRTNSFFLIAFGVGESFAIPVRVLQPEELETAAHLLERNLKERYSDRSTKDKAEPTQ